MSSFGRDDEDLHNPRGGHRRRPVGASPEWNRRMEAHVILHRRRAALKGADPWEAGHHVPRQLRTHIAES